jgi:hypothetical protein
MAMLVVGILLVITRGYIFDISPYVSVYHYEIPLKKKTMFAGYILLNHHLYCLNPIPHMFHVWYIYLQNWVIKME